MSSIAVVDGLDVSALRLFLASVELGSVSKAARRMRLSQPSATAKLHKLERQLGTQLLERTPTGSRPTGAGERLTTACADVVASATSLVDRAEALRSERDVLTIATTRHVADHFLPQWVSAVPQGAHVELSEGDTLHNAQRVRSGEADLGFTEGPHTPIGLRSRVVATERVVAVVGRGHRWADRRRSLRAADLSDATILLGRPGSGTRDLVEATLAEHDWRGDGERIEVDGPSAARVAALSGVGVAFLPRCWVHDHIERGLLAELRVADVEIEQEVRLVWRGSEPGSTSARRFASSLTGVTPGV